ncbi:PH domain-containing protein [Solwaraspora sp. WMMD792]|uniref:PH domain-containing protein n=1 Tax=Solwaraspora sp. WMMD792 TaxID=3016099 RepID=UPI00241769C0|nr:PH domain-containing protein [Solwaraspora sp. WMMD792]MDG4769590.1 PH domain-containing protein [Solwaraspora sp. WMMD792]
MSRRVTVRFRPHQAIMLAAVIAFVGSLPLASARWYLLPVLLLPLAIAIWAVRSGTDADPAGLRVRALIGQRRIGWSRVAELAADPQGRAVALLTDGERVRLPAVRADDLPRLIAASGQPLDPATPPTPLNPATPPTDATDEPATPPTQ